jgi:hypothetical protein
VAFFLLLPSFGNANEEDHPAYTKYVAEITNAFAKQIKTEYGLECESSGGSMPYDVEIISIKFAAYQRATISEARELEIQITEQFVKTINSHEKIRPFLREFPFPASRTRVGISFLKQNNTPYIDGSVSYVFHAKNIIFYNAENPQNPYIDDIIKKEPYEEALKIVQEKATPTQIP